MQSGRVAKQFESENGHASQTCGENAEEQQEPPATGEDDPSKTCGKDADEEGESFAPADTPMAQAQDPERDFDISRFRPNPAT